MLSFNFPELYNSQEGAGFGKLKLWLDKNKEFFSPSVMVGLCFSKNSSCLVTVILHCPWRILGAICRKNIVHISSRKLSIYSVKKIVSDQNEGSHTQHFVSGGVLGKSARTDETLQLPFAVQGHPNPEVMCFYLKAFGEFS